MDSNQFREAAHSAVEQIIDYYDNIQDRRVTSDVSPGYLRPLLPSGPPVEGESWSTIQADIEAKIMPGITHWQSPNFMAFFPASSTYPGMLGELYSGAFTAAAFNWSCSPAITELETVMMDWLAELFGLPECFLSKGKGGGVIQGTTSEAIATMVVVARDRYLQETTKHLEGEAREDAIGEKRGKLVALGSSQAHSSTQKAAMVAGTRYMSVPASKDDDFGMRGEALAATIRKCQSKGLEPFFLTATMGTTTTCAVDNFGEIAEVVKAHPLIWTHVDAAYAGAALVCPEFQHFTDHFGVFDSFCMNMHKWLLTNFDCCCLWVRRRKPLIDALSITPAYLRNEFSESGLVTDYRDWQIPLGRRFRSLKIWFVLRTYGVEGLREHIREHIRLGKLFAKLIEGRKDLFAISSKPAFALTVFSVVPSAAALIDSPVENGVENGLKSAPITNGTTNGHKSGPSEYGMSNGHTNGGDVTPLAKANAVTKKIYELINSRGEIMLTNSMLNGEYVIRVVSANPKAEEKYVRNAYEIVQRTTEEVLGLNHASLKRKASELD
ncbi:MAG: hypothetical protein M1814_002101 [Vezdaea aestivalis]|nr:MAG: hypothetical protein M1814_002101 [Vezdaea aestivalis]